MIKFSRRHFYVISIIVLFLISLFLTGLAINANAQTYGDHYDYDYKRNAQLERQAEALEEQSRQMRRANYYRYRADQRAKADRLNSIEHCFVSHGKKYCL